MKYLIIFFLLLTSFAYADTYSKDSDNNFVVTKEVSEAKSYNQLVKDKEGAEAELVILHKKYTDDVKAYQNNIAKINALIVEAKKLGLDK